MKVGLTPARWTVVEKQHVCSLSKYPVSRKYPLGWVALDEDLARFLGFYVAEGSVDGSSIYLALFDTELEKLVTDILKKVDHRFSVRIRQDTKGVKRDMVCNVGKRFAAFVADICGRGAANKRVPTELFFAPTNVIRAFLDGYLSGDGTVGTNRVVAGTVSEELRDGVLLLLARLGLVASVGQETPKSQFAVMNERFKIAVGGYYATALSLSGRKEESLADLYRVTTEQTPYDYEYLRPLIAKVYGVKSRNAHQYRIKPLYIEELIADLKSRILTDSEKDLVEKLATLDFWFKELSSVINDIESTERHHLRRLIGEKRLPRFCNYLPVFLPYEDWLGRFLLLLDLGLRKRGGRIHNDCRSPGLVMRWARAVLERNEAMGVLLEKLERAFEIRPVRVAAIDELPHEPYVYDISVDGNENFLTAQGIFVHNSRAGAQVPFSSINLGTETGEAARKVTRNLLLAYEAGLGRNEAPIFPNIIFRVKKGVNFNQGDPNHDLFQLAVRVAAKRLNPTFSFMDAGFNAPYGEQVSYMGCRSRVMANRRGPEVTEGRGNLSFTTMNLPRIAVKAERDVNKFFKLLDAVAELGIRQLYHRYELQAKLKVKDIPFVMGQSLYMGAAGLKPEQSVAEAIKHGTLSLGFIGLAEALVALLGKHHGQDAGAQELGIEIVSWLRRKIDEACDKYDLNYTLLATPAEGTAGRFIKPDRREFGIVPGVNDKDYYTNSFHVPVHFPIECFRKIEIEGPYHKFCNAGHISYVELPSPPVENPEAVEAIVRYMAEQDMGYVGVNFPVDFCESCSFAGVLDDECPKCGSTAIRRVRRITGYLSTVDRFNDAKVAELKSRLVHLGRPGTLQ